MLDEAKLKRILKELFENDDDVPSDWNPRCSELNWFSSGVKNNVVAYIYKQMFGEPIAEKSMLSLPDMAQPTIIEDEHGKRTLAMWEQLCPVGLRKRKSSHSALQHTH